VVPIIVGHSFNAGCLALSLLEHQIYAMPITFPAVKEGTARLRFFLSAAHSEEHIRHTLDLVARELPQAVERAAAIREEMAKGQR
jgi:7-keto-8-aminopelargonate synthetase-like enzyme